MIDYDPHDWLSHFLDIRGSMVREITGRVMVCVAWSALVVAVHGYVWPVALPPTVHTLIGVALGLLLVFRTNASYDRYWEGRRQWGSIVNSSRNLGTMARAYLGRAPAIREAVVLYTVAFAYSSMGSLRGKREFGPTGGRLPGPEVDSALSARHVPLAIVGRIRGLLAVARADGILSDYERVELDRVVGGLVDNLGACERIRNTPLPFVYVVHLRRAVILYCFTLPFALADAYGWATVADMFLVAYILFGIEEIGVQIEDPFGCDPNDLPLERICATIERDLLGLIDDRGIDGAPAEGPSAEGLARGDGARVAT